MKISQFKLEFTPKTKEELALMSEEEVAAYESSADYIAYQNNSIEEAQAKMLFNLYRSGSEVKVVEHLNEKGKIVSKDIPQELEKGIENATVYVGRTTLFDTNRSIQITISWQVKNKDGKIATYFTRDLRARGEWETWNMNPGDILEECDLTFEKVNGENPFIGAILNAPNYIKEKLEAAYATQKVKNIAVVKYGNQNHTPNTVILPEHGSTQKAGRLASGFQG